MAIQCITGFANVSPEYNLMSRPALEKTVNDIELVFTR
jgi:hypothetical protein